jgi:hypothetical protein
VTDPGPLDGDRAEGGLEGIGSGPSTLDATTAFAPATLQDQLLVRLLNEGPEELPLDLQAGAMSERLDRVGQMLVLVGQGHSHPQRKVQ